MYYRWWGIIAGFFGLFFGSFASVVFLRRKDAQTWKEASSILRGRSACPVCHHRLAARDLVPLVSFLFLQGKCRYCKAPLSWKYPFLEITSALLFAGVVSYALSLGADWGMLFFRVFSIRGLYLLLLYDIFYYELHLPIYGVLLALVFVPLIAGYLSISSLYFLLLRGGAFLFLYFLGRLIVYRKYQLKAEGFWMGDVIVAPYLALLLSIWYPEITTWSLILLFLFFILLSWIFALLQYIIQIVYFKAIDATLDPALREQALPFLPAMILATFVLMLWGSALLEYFWGF